MAAVAWWQRATLLPPPPPLPPPLTTPPSPPLPMPPPPTPPPPPPHFLLVLPLLFVRLLPLQGDAFFGGPFLLWQVALSSTSLTSDAAAPDVDTPPFALSGASPSLHAQHEEQCFLFLLEPFEWLHWWHGHDEARRVADRSSGILLRESKREIGRVAAGLARKLRQEDHYQFLSVELTCAALGTDRIQPRTSKGGKAKEIPSCPCYHIRRGISPCWSDLRVNSDLTPSYLRAP